MASVTVPDTAMPASLARTIVRSSPSAPGAATETDLKPAASTRYSSGSACPTWTVALPSASVDASVAATVSGSLARIFPPETGRPSGSTTRRCNDRPVSSTTWSGPGSVFASSLMTLGTNPFALKETRVASG